LVYNNLNKPIGRNRKWNNVKPLLKTENLTKEFGSLALNVTEPEKSLDSLTTLKEFASNVKVLKVGGSNAGSSRIRRMNVGRRQRLGKKLGKRPNDWNG